MVIIARRQIDVRPIIGAAVIFLIIGSIVFGVYYFAIAKPAADALDASKQSAMSQINSNLATIGTSQASTAAASYISQVQAAGSKTDVDSILVSVNTAVQTEQKRDELIKLVDSAANGAYYSATGTSGTTQVQTLTNLSQTLKSGVNAKGTRAELDTYESEINSQATSTWRTFFTDMLENFGENLAKYQKNSTESGGYVSNDNALTDIAGWSWGTLSKLKFENKSTVEVPVLDTFQRTPTIKPNSKVNIYVYDTATKSMSQLWTNVTVRNVIYSKSDIATIAWTLSDGATTQSYSTNMWETIQASAAGDSEAAAVSWSNYGSTLMSNALSANIGGYTVSVIYMVEVPDSIGEQIAQYEFHQSTTKDVILIATV